MLGVLTRDSIITMWHVVALLTCDSRERAKKIGVLGAVVWQRRHQGIAVLGDRVKTGN